MNNLKGLPAIMSVILLNGCSGINPKDVSSTASGRRLILEVAATEIEHYNYVHGVPPADYSQIRDNLETGKNCAKIKVDPRYLISWALATSHPIRVPYEERLVNLTIEGRGNKTTEQHVLRFYTKDAWIVEYEWNDALGDIEVVMSEANLAHFLATSAFTAFEKKQAWLPMTDAVLSRHEGSALRDRDAFSGLILSYSGDRILVTSRKSGVTYSYSKLGPKADIRVVIWPRLPYSTDEL